MLPDGAAEKLTEELTAYARLQGVDLVGCTTPRPFTVGDRAEPVTPEQHLPGVRSIVMAACYSYGSEAYRPSEPGRPRGRLGPYTRLEAPTYRHLQHVLTSFLTERDYQVVPAHELPNKALAVRTGIVSYGKNCIVHADGLGSYLTLSGVLTDAELACRDRAIESTDCPEDCRECVEACPTGALATPFRLARQKCICSYLWGDPLPREHREAVGDRLFRCEACQQACPRNQRLVPRAHFPAPPQRGEDSPELIPLLLGDERYYQEAIPSFTQEAGLDTLRRNAAVAAGNGGDPATVPALLTCLDSAHTLTRIAAAWALGRLAGPEARRALSSRWPREEDAEVREEIEIALRS